MDNELKKIQADLDKVLDNLVEYMSSGKMSSDFEPQPSNRINAARAALHYVFTNNGSLEASIEASRCFNRGPNKYHPILMLGPQTENPPSELVKLREALICVADWEYTRWPLEDKYMRILSEAVAAWSIKECQFIGETAGLTLTPKREVDRRQRVRYKAAMYALELHSRDPQNNPVDQSLFEEAGKHYAMSSRTVSRTYYSPFFSKMRAAHKNLINQALSRSEET